LRRTVLGDSTSRVNTHSTTTNRYAASSLSEGHQHECGTPHKFIDFDDGMTNGQCSASFKQRCSSVPRRQSFGGSGLLSLSTAVNSYSTETPIRDRRAVLEAWRKGRVVDTASDGVTEDPSSILSRKRTRGGTAPLLPPSSKHYRTNLSQDHASNSFGQSFHQNNHHGETEVHSESSNLSSRMAIDYCDNDVENHSSIFTARTPSTRRGTMGSARRKSLMGRNIYHVNEGKWHESKILIVFHFTNVYSSIC
jgi:hypothetical protein